MNPTKENTTFRFDKFFIPQWLEILPLEGEISGNSFVPVSLVIKINEEHRYKGSELLLTTFAYMY